MPTNLKPAEVEPLTMRETEVLKLICDGLPNKGVAGQLGISIKTVEKHRGELNRKFGTQGEINLFRAAVRKGFVTLEEATC
jgi:DNA-binding NarL/FixJ family response regulator